MPDGQVEIGVEITDDGVQSQAQRVGAEAGRGIESGIREGAENSGGLLDKLKGKFSTAFAAIGGIVAGFSMADMAAEIVNVGKSFEESMSKVAALSGAAGDDLAALQAKARELGAATTYSASEAADALGYMALAGWDTEQMLDGVGGVLTLAQAGQMDLAQSSDLVTDYLSAFGMEANETGRMVDVLAYAQANANTTVDGLGMAFKNAAANAHAAGMDVETTTAAISMLANQGLKGSEAGTALAAVMRDMTAKMEDGAIKIGDTAVAVQDSEGNYRDFVAILSDVEAATEGMGDAERAAALMSTFTADSIKGLNLMLNAGTDELASFREELYASSGAGQNLADTMTDNLQGDLSNLESALEELQLTIFEGLREPLRDVTQFASNVVVPGITTLVKNFDKVGPVLAAIGVSLLAYRKGWDIVTASQKIAAKVAEASTATYTRYFSVVRNGETVFYKWDKATQSYVVTQKTLAASLATTSAGMKAQGIAAKASAAAMEVGGKAARTLGGALKTIAPVAAMSLVVELVMKIGDNMRQAAEDADNLERATEGLSSALSSAGDAASGLDGISEGYEKSAEEIVEASREVIASQAEFADSVRGSMTELGTSSAMIDEYTGVIERLSGKAGLTAEEQAQLTAAVSGLNEVCGTTYQVVDAVNGQLSASTEEIIGNTEAWKRNAEAQAYQELYQEAVKKSIENEQQLAEVRDELAKQNEEFTMYYTGEAMYISDNADKIRQLEEQERNLEKTSDALTASKEELAQKYGESAQAANEMAQASGEAAQANADNASAAGDAAAASEQLSEANSKVVEEIQEAAIKSGAFANALGESGYTAEELAEVLTATGISAGDLADAVESTADKTANAFELIEEKSDVSLEKMLETLQKNAETTENWSENITTLYDRAGSESERRFIQYLANMGPEYAPILQQLVDDSTGKLSELAEAWSHGVDVGSEAVIEQAGGMAESVNEELDEATERASEQGGEMDDAYAQSVRDNSGAISNATDGAGDEAVDALTDSVTSRVSDVEDAFSDVTEAGTDAAEEKGRKGGAKAGTASAKAEASAMRKQLPTLKSAGGSLGDAGAAGAKSKIPLYSAPGLEGTKAYARGVLAGKTLAEFNAKSVAGGAVTGIGSRNSETNGIGLNFGQGFGKGIGGAGGAVVRAATGLANKAMSSMKKALEIKSPSRKAEKEVGRNLALGVARGIEKNDKYAKLSAAKLGNEVVDAAKTRLSKYKRTHDMSLKEEQRYWKEIAKHTKKGSKARAEALQLYKEARKKADDQVKKEVDSYRKSVESVQSKLAKAEKDYADKVADIQADMLENEEDYRKDVAEIQQQMVEDEQEYRQELADIQQQLVDDIEEANRKYAEAVESRKQSVLGGFDVFSRFNHDEIANADALLESMRMQAEAAQEYSENVVRLKERIGEGELFDEITDQGVGALAQIKALNAMADYQLQEYARLYQERSDAAYKTAVAESEKDRLETIENIEKMKKEADRQTAQAHETFEKAKNEAQRQLGEVYQQFQQAQAKAQQQMEEAYASLVKARAEADAEIRRLSADLASEMAKLGTSASNSVAAMARNIANSSGSIIDSVDKAIAAISKLNSSSSTTGMIQSGIGSIGGSISGVIGGIAGARIVQSAAMAAVPASVAYDAEGMVRGVSVEPRAAIMGQVSESVRSSVGGITLARSGATTNNNTSNQTINFNQPVRSPDEITRELRMYQRYQLAGKRGA